MTAHDTDIFVKIDYSTLLDTIKAMLPGGYDHARDFENVWEFMELIGVLDASCEMCASSALKSSVPDLHEQDVMDRLIDSERVRRFGRDTLKLTDTQIASVVADAFFNR